MGLGKEFICIQRNDQNFDSNYDRDIYRISDRILPIAAALPTKPEELVIDENDDEDTKKAKQDEYDKKLDEYNDSLDQIINPAIGGSVIHEKYFPKINPEKLRDDDKLNGIVHDIETYDDKTRILITDDGNGKNTGVLKLKDGVKVEDIRYINLNGLTVSGDIYPPNALIKNGIFKYKSTDPDVTSEVILDVSNKYPKCEISNFGNNKLSEDADYEEVSLLPVPGYNTISNSKVKLVNLIPGREYSIDLIDSRIVGEVDGSPLLLNLNKTYTLNEKDWESGTTTILSILAVTSDTFVLCRNLSPKLSK